MLIQFKPSTCRKSLLLRQRGAGEGMWAQLLRMAKNTGTAIFIAGHVTKEGAIAGPRVLEHMVDTVLYFEGERHTQYRILQAVKPIRGFGNRSL